MLARNLRHPNQVDQPCLRKGRYKANACFFQGIVNHMRIGQRNRQRSPPCASSQYYKESSGLGICTRQRPIVVPCGPCSGGFALPQISTSIYTKTFQVLDQNASMYNTTSTPQ